MLSDGVENIIGKYYYRLCSSSGFIKTATFRKLLLFSSSGEHHTQENLLHWSSQLIRGVVKQAAAGLAVVESWLASR
jgi:hypothetical protein